MREAELVVEEEEEVRAVWEVRVRRGGTSMRRSEREVLRSREGRAEPRVEVVPGLEGGWMMLTGRDWP